MTSFTNNMEPGCHKPSSGAKPINQTHAPSPIVFGNIFQLKFPLGLPEEPKYNKLIHRNILRPNFIEAAIHLLTTILGNLRLGAVYLSVLFWISPWLNLNVPDTDQQAKTWCQLVNEILKYKLDHPTTNIDQLKCIWNLSLEQDTPFYIFGLCILVHGNIVRNHWPYSLTPLLLLACPFAYLEIDGQW